MEGLWQNTLDKSPEKDIVWKDSTEELFDNLEGVSLWDLQEMKDSEDGLNHLEEAEKETALIDIKWTLGDLSLAIRSGIEERGWEGLASIRVVKNPETERGIETEYKTDTQALKTELEQTDFNSLLVSELMENLNDKVTEDADIYSLEQMKEELLAQGVAAAELEELMKNITRSA